MKQARQLPPGEYSDSLASQEGHDLMLYFQPAQELGGGQSGLTSAYHWLIERGSVQLQLINIALMDNALSINV